MQALPSRVLSPSPIQRFAAGGETGPPGRRDVRHDMAWHCRRLAAETRGDRAPMVPFPLLTPQTLLWTRLPPVARLNARGPQGRLVLQGFILDRSGAFRSGTLPPCTVWPRTVMRGKSRKVNSGHNSVQKSARRTEPSPRNPRFAAHLRCVSAKEGEGSQEGTGNHTWCPVPFCLRRKTAAFPPVNTGNPPPPKAALVIPDKWQHPFFP